MPMIEPWYNNSLLTYIKDNPEGVSKDDLVLLSYKKELQFNYTDLETLMELGKIIEKDDKYFYKKRP